MFMLYLLWITVVGGGLFMAIGAAWTILEQGFDVALALNVVLYLGCALYGLPRLVKLIASRWAPSEGMFRWPPSGGTGKS